MAQKEKNARAIINAYNSTTDSNSILYRFKNTLKDV